MNKLILATTNRHKLTEFRDFFAGLGIEILSPVDLNLDFQVEENGKTFAENSKIKSSELFRLTGIPAIADDSGICVDALHGRPGIHSARYGGDGLTDRDRAIHLLEELKGETNRNASFECVISLTDKNGVLYFKGTCDGEITEDYDEGGSTFGYDPVFYYPPLKQRFSRLSPAEKNKISHRGRAMEKLKEFLAN